MVWNHQLDCGLLVWIFGSEVFFSWRKASRPSRKRKFESMIFLFQVGQDMYGYVLGVAPSQDSSDHQDYYIFSRDPHKPSYATVAGRGPTPKICYYLGGCMPCWWFLLLHFLSPNSDQKIEQRVSNPALAWSLHRSLPHKSLESLSFLWFFAEFLGDGTWEKMLFQFPTPRILLP